MIGLLIVAHGTLGESLIHCASHVVGKRPMYLRQLGVTIHDDPDAILPQGRDLIRFVDQGDGVLVMTDIFGATPSNIACKLLDAGRVEGISGVNLPMLIRALTYRERPMTELIEKAIAGGTEGIIQMPASRCEALGSTI
jgi:PTS system ascorbate-specific IIA component